MARLYGELNTNISPNTDLPRDKEEMMDSIFTVNDVLYGKKVNPVPTPEKNFGVDVKNSIYQNIINTGDISRLDISKIQEFSTIATSRNQLYDALDTMGEDSTIAAVLETYAEDVTEYNDQGRIVWAEASDANISKYVNWLIDTLNIDKNIYKWAYSLIKYGDIYLRLYRESDYNKVMEFGKRKKHLNENVLIKAYRPDDKFVHYLEMIPNPATVFELTRFGETAGYIQANVNTVNSAYQNSQLTSGIYYSAYSFKESDNNVRIFPATEFVHGALEDNTSRVPEKVDLLFDVTEDDIDAKQSINDADIDSDISMSYSVKRGQSLLYSAYKSWRELMLLQNSILLNRLTKSSLVRIIGVEVGDMDKNMVQSHLAGIKQLIEQKSAINTGIQMSEYTNAGPVENNVYIPTHNGIGAITMSDIGGGDTNVSNLADLDYFTSELFGALKVPKQYFGQTGDSAGFDAGKSLSLMSSRYAKTVKRIQNTLTQMLTDAINIMLHNNGLENYINQFTLRMLPPTTQEELDRHDAIDKKLGTIGTIMDQLSDIQDPALRLKMLKSLLSSVIDNPEITEILQQEIDSLESQEDEVENEYDGSTENDFGFDENEPLDLNSEESTGDSNRFLSTNDSVEVRSEPASQPRESSSEDSLPTPDELGVGDFSDNSQF